MRKRRVVLSIVLLLLIGLGLAVAWRHCDWPPVRMVLEYGLTPGCRPTGRTIELEGVEFVEIGPGCFRMGSDALGERADLLWVISEPFGLEWGEAAALSHEMPVHWVEFPNGYWIARTEITNEQFERFSEMGVGDRRDVSPGDRCPAVDLSFRDAQDYCKWLEEVTGLPVRLPSEAEWECACRAGRSSEFSFGDQEALLTGHAWCLDNSESRAHDAGTRSANDWGLADMHGNVWEWVEDTFHRGYSEAPIDGSAWIVGGRKGYEGTFERVLRGGGWTSEAGDCRAAYRYSNKPLMRSGSVGFRPAIPGGAVPD